ncbi:MAG: hypothetical protein SOZ34_03485 [Clostridia bacterium]|nr:hypothetical protein [Clostridia bacterium]
MKNLSKQVVILDNISSPYIHQAIIILKSYPEGQHDKIIAEAERIVASYFDKKIPSEISPKNTSNTGLKLAVAFLSTALFFSILIPMIH